MGILNWEDEELISRSAATGIVAARASMDGGTNAEIFKRVWPPSPGTVGGNTLGFLRYLSRSPASALRVDSPKGYSLTLDRSVTAPNAVIAIAFDKPTQYRSGWMFLFPGETIFVPGSFTRFWMFNADGLDRVSTDTNDYPLGYCGFLIGTQQNGAKPDQSETLPAARIIGMMNSGTLAMYLGRGRMRRLGVQAIGVDASAQPLQSAFFTSFSIAMSLRAQTAIADFRNETLDELDPSAFFGTVLVHSMIATAGRSAHTTVDVPEGDLILFAHDRAQTYFGTAISSYVYQLTAAD